MQQIRNMRHSLLGLSLRHTSRVIFPAEAPAIHPWRVVIYYDSRLALGRETLSLIAFGDDPDAEARNRWIAALEDLVALAIIKRGGPELPPELRHPPRPREVKSALSPGLRRFQRVLNLAHQLVDHDGNVSGVVKARAARQVGGFGGLPRPAHKIRAREVQPFLPLIHLALPFVARWRQSDEYERKYPERTPWAIPLSFAELLESDAWPLVLLDSAEHWRQALPFTGIEVRADKYSPNGG